MHWSEDNKIDLRWSYTTDDFGNLSNRVRTNKKEKFREWRQRHKDNWKKIILDMHKEYVAITTIKDTAKANHRNTMYKIAERTKLLVLLPLGTALIYLSYYIGVIMLLIREHPMDFLFGVAATILATMAGSLLFVWIVVSCEEGGRFPEFFKAVLRTIGKPIWAVLSFFGMNIKLLYKNFCPQIEWKD